MVVCQAIDTLDRAPKACLVSLSFFLFYERFIRSGRRVGAVDNGRHQLTAERYAGRCPGAVRRAEAPRRAEQFEAGLALVRRHRARPHVVRRERDDGVRRRARIAARRRLTCTRQKRFYNINRSTPTTTLIGKTLFLVNQFDRGKKCTNRKQISLFGY